MNRMNFMRFSHLLFYILLFLLLTGVVTSDSTNNTSFSTTPQSGLALTTDVGIFDSHTPDVAEMETPFSAGIGIINNGPAAAEEIQIDYYLVRYNETDARPIWLHQKTADEIPAFYKNVVDFTVDLPGGITPGLYTLFSTIHTTTVDRNLSNNQYLSKTPIKIKKSISSITAEKADLSVNIDSISSSETAPGYPFTINYTVFNTGNETAGTFHVGFYLSSDQNIEPSDIRLWDEIYYKAYPGMKEPGESIDIIPAEVPPGEYYPGAIIDFTNMVPETDEENNTANFDIPVKILQTSPPVDENFLSRVSGYIVLKTNKYRQYRGLSNLSYDLNLADIARLHSIDMATRNYFAHATPEGVDPDGRAEAAKYDIIKRRTDGSIRTGIAENIVKISGGYIIGEGYSGFVDPSDPQAVADAMMVEWISSPEHDENLINPDIDRIGVGVAYNGEYFYATQNFY
jgi:uncharacterized protein YkwD